MLSVRPLTDSFAIAYAHDPAFDVTRDGFAEEYARCVERLDFSSITLPGQTPTLFHFRALRGSQLHRLRSYNLQGDSAWAWLVFRLCLVRVEAGGPELEKIDRIADPEYKELGPIVSPKWVDMAAGISVALGRHAGELLDMLGAIVLMRSVAPSPPS
jgi:hypothetical protein